MGAFAAKNVSGAPCLKGHTERYRSGACAVCRRDSERRRYASDPAAFASKRRREYQRRAEHYRAARKQWRQNNPEREREIKRAFYHRHKHDLLPKMREQGHKKIGMPEPTRPRPENCELCGKPEPRGVLHLDHCHLSNKFRGWLCSKCNLGLGQLGDTAESLRAALAYLEKA